MGPFEALGKRVLHEWAAWRLVERQFRDPHGNSFARTFVESPGVVAIAAVDDRERLVMVRQYRPALDMTLWEIPAGMRDVEGESPLTCAQRELREETGFVAVEWAELGRVAQSPGTSNSIAEVFLARRLTAGEAAPQGPEENSSTIHLVDVGEAIRMVERGEVINSLAIIGILRAASMMGSD
jgi:ADP-ribose pyrophosphatase